MAIFNSYVKLPEGIAHELRSTFAHRPSPRLWSCSFTEVFSQDFRHGGGRKIAGTPVGCFIHHVLKRLRLISCGKKKYPMTHYMDSIWF